jgi:hypothetical protein
MSKARPSVNLAIGATRGWKRAPDDAPEPGGYDAGPAPGHQRPARAQLTWGRSSASNHRPELRPPIPSGAAASMPEITERAGLARLRAAPTRHISAEITQLCALRSAENPRLKNRPDRRIWNFLDVSSHITITLTKLPIENCAVPSVLGTPGLGVRKLPVVCVPVLG